MNPMTDEEYTAHLKGIQKLSVHDRSIKYVVAEARKIRSDLIFFTIPRGCGIHLLFRPKTTADSNNVQNIRNHTDE